MAFDSSAAHRAPDDTNVVDEGNWQGGLPVLRCSRVVLREPELADAEALFDALSNAAVGRFMTPPPNSVSGFETFIAWLQNARRAGHGFSYAIVPAGQERAAGLIQMRAIDSGFALAEWGFALDPAHWGTGLFMGAATNTVDFAVRHLRVHRLEARASVLNGRATGALRKLGAAPEGMLRESSGPAAQRVDQTLWAVLAAEWMAAHRPSYDVVAAGRSTEHVGVGETERTRAPWCEALPVLSGRRVALRELEPGDGALMEALNEPEVRRYTMVPVGSDAFARFQQRSVSQRKAGRHVCFVVVPHGATTPVGLIQLRALEPSCQTAEWGFALARPSWGTGLFAEAASLFLDFAFDVVGAHRLEARSAFGNWRARRALRRLGSVFEGRLRQSFLMGGQFHDDALFAILSADWRRLRLRDRSIA